jgi:dihydrodipicolinate synthase/N-acetylneuraminate lyase
MSSLEDIWIPVVTPFRNGSVDLDTAQRLAVEVVCMASSYAVRKGNRRP